MQSLWRKCSGILDNLHTKLAYGGMREMRKYWKVAAGLVLLLHLQSCKKETAEEAEADPTVTVAPAIAKKLVEMDSYTGRIEAPQTVEVRSQVEGILQEVKFTDGAMVQEGYVLFVIDQRRYKAALLSAEGRVAEAKAQHDLATSERDRSVNLLKTNAISKQESDKQSSQVDLSSAILMQAQAQYDKAKFDLDNTEIRSPLSGQAGMALKQKGSLIGVDTLLTTIRSNETAWVYLDIDERSILRYQRLSNQLKADNIPENDSLMDVQLSLADEGQTYPHRGRFDFNDNRLDPTTGTLRARAVFPNPDSLLFPGLFARVKVPGSLEKEVILVPSEAVGSDQTNKFVFVVKPDKTVEQRTIEAGPELDGDRIIRSGLSAGELVIVAGQLQVRPGSKVIPEPAATPTPTPSPSPAAEPAPTPTPGS